MTSTLSVPRELLEELRDAANEGMNATTRQHQIDYFAGLIAKTDALLSAQSPAGVDGLEVVAWLCEWMGDKCGGVYSGLSKTSLEGLRRSQGEDVLIVSDEPLCRLSDATAIIDGLRGEVGAQEETANQWRDLALQFDRHRMTAMAHIRAAASGDKSAIEALGVFAALPPIPGHEITTERDQLLAQRDKLAELLRDVRKGVHWQIMANRIDTALSELPK